MSVQEGRRRRDAGIERAVVGRVSQLQRARHFALRLAARNGTVTSDDVRVVWKRMVGESWIGPAAGALFQSREFEFTGEFVQSNVPTNNARLLRVWKLKGA